MFTRPLCSRSIVRRKLDFSKYIILVSKLRTIHCIYVHHNRLESILHYSHVVNYINIICRSAMLFSLYCDEIRFEANVGYNHIEEILIISQSSEKEQKKRVIEHASPRIHQINLIEAQYVFFDLI